MDEESVETTQTFKVVMLVLAIALIVIAYSIYDQQYLTVRSHEIPGWSAPRTKYTSITFLDIRPISIIVFAIGFFLLVSAATTHTTGVDTETAPRKEYGEVG